MTRLTPEREQQIREWSGPLTGTPWPEIWAELDAVRAELAKARERGDALAETRQDTETYWAALATWRELWK